MKKIILVLTLLVGVHVFGQIHEPVKWGTSVEKISKTEYELIATATIERDWHLYSQSVPEDGPIPTKFTFQGSGSYLKK